MRLFLDDFRKPHHCIAYMSARIGFKAAIYQDQQWIVVKNYNEFVKAVTEQTFSLISFDHDLSDEHYQTDDVNKHTEKTGLDCAIWLKKFYEENNKSLPQIVIHSMNPVGVERIKQVFER